MAAVETQIGHLTVKITSTLSSFGTENRFNTSLSIRELKGKLELVTGATASLVELQLFDSYDKPVCMLDNDSATIGSYPIENGFRIHVINKDPSKIKGEFDDVSKVEKYEMSDDDYSKRTDSLLAFKKKMKLGQFSEPDPNAEAEAAAKEAKEEEEAKAIAVTSRCEVVLPDAMPKRGTVMFVGKLESKKGYFVGVKYDEPLGKNDGSVEGKRYFQCPPKYGAFVKPKNVTVGDFPEETFSDDEM